MFLWRRVRMMATSLLRSLRGLRLFLPLAVSTSVFFTICSRKKLRQRCPTLKAKSML